MRLTILMLFLSSVSTSLMAQEQCVTIREDVQRLTCYDEVFAQEKQLASEKNASEEELANGEYPPVLVSFYQALEAGSAQELIKLSETLTDFSQLGDDARSRAVAAILAYVRPLPAANAAANRDGYAALVKLMPDNEKYQQKHNYYVELFERNRLSLVKRMKKSTDEFTGNVFFEHPNTPRYSDIRSYLSLYAGQNGERVWLRMRLNYTNDNWLFVQNAALNIDGETIRLPYYDWKRENDTEIWEWIDVSLDEDLREILEKIAASQSTIIRFNGQQYYDNVTVSDQDKQVIRDMFLVEEILREKSS